MADSEFENKIKEYFGKKIINAEISNNKTLKIFFDDKTCVHIFDNGQSCCEDRYMSTDDDFSSIIGNILTNVEIKDVGKTTEEDSEVHDIEFLEITADKGFIIIANHNQHNGYYGGFDIDLREFR